MTKTRIKISTAPSSSSSSTETAKQTYRVQRTPLSLRKSNPSTQAPSSKLLSYPLFSGLRHKVASANRKPADGNRVWRIFPEMFDAFQSFIQSTKAICSTADDCISHVLCYSNMTKTTQSVTHRHLQKSDTNALTHPFLTM